MKKKRKFNQLDLYSGDKDIINFKPMLFIDFEYITSSFRQDGRRVHIQEIVEVAGIYIDDTIQSKFTTIIKPTLYFTHNIINQSVNNKFSIEELLNGTDLLTIVSEIKKYYIPGKTKVISWGGSDLHNINCLCKTNNINFYIRKDDYVDLSQKFRRFYKLTQAVTLEKALSILKLDISYEKHRAMPDAEVLLSIFEDMVSDGYLDSELILF